MGPEPDSGMRRRDRDLGRYWQVESTVLINQLEVRREGRDKKPRDASFERVRGW